VVFWVSAFLDFPAADADRGTAFWSAVTGYAVSPARGETGEFATLVPAVGDDYLRVQRLADGPGRIHLDLHVDDPAVSTADAVTRGGEEVARPDGYVVLRSPAGFVFCFVTHRASTVPPPAWWPGVRRSRVYQVCLDIPSAAFDAEAAFWAGIFGGRVEVLVRRPEFAWLRTPGAPRALDLLLQRLDRPDGPMAAHLDLGTPDRPAETERHLALGATLVAREEFWTVLADPTGAAYCITDRDPATGRLS